MTALPSKDQILAFIRENPTQISRRDIARAFGIKGDDRAALRSLLKSMQDEGLIERGSGRRFGVPDGLPPVGVVQIVDIDTDGEVIAEPLNWQGDGAAPKIIMQPEKAGRAAAGIGDRVLARLARTEDEDVYEGRTIRRLEGEPRRILGVFKSRHGESGEVRPIERGSKDVFLIRPGDRGGAESGELVMIEPVRGRRGERKTAKIIERFDSDHDHGPSPSLIAIHSHDLRVAFPPAAITEAEQAKLPRLGKREDLRSLPLVTIDGADARDFDDAVFAAPDEDPGNAGGFHLIVAIADVAYYVRPDSALDREAQKRGNSTYFPDRVVPMLPEALSNGLCSLRPKETRASLAFHLWIDGEGRLKRHRITRALIKSVARLTYDQVEQARRGKPDKLTRPLLDDVITPLYAAFDALSADRRKRGTLELDLPERQVMIGKDGKVERIAERERFDSHRLIEEFMICANIAAAEALEAARHPCFYRVHDRPDGEKLDGLRSFVRGLGLNLAKGQVIKAGNLTELLRKASAQGFNDLVSDLVLRAQSQAVYSPQNIGHFGLALRRYAHFTSPIRRYADLLVHRALIRAYRLGPGGMADDELARLDELAMQISRSERKSMQAERDAVDRFTAGWLAQRVGEVFTGRITGVTRFGLFVRLGDTGADGLVPIRNLGNDYFTHDGNAHALIGRRTGIVYRLGATVKVRIVEADGLTGSTVLDLTDTEGADLPGLAPPEASKPRARRPSSGRRKTGGKRRRK